MPEKPTRKKVVRKTVHKSNRKGIIKKPMSRKAPTPIARDRANSVRKQKILTIVGVLFFVIIGLSVFIGNTGTGSIDVTDIIAEKKLNASPEELKDLNTITTQKQKKSVPLGGLIPSGKEEEIKAKKPLPVVEDTASSSEDTASSTEEVATAETTEINGEEALPTTEIISEVTASTTE